MDRRLRNGILGILVLVCAWYAADRLLRREARDAAPIPEGPLAEGVDVSDSVTARTPMVPEPDRSPELPPRAAKDVLGEYWGDRWPEVEQRLKDKNVDLGVSFELVPWETAALTIEPLIPLTNEERAQQSRNVLQWPVGLEPTELANWLKTEFNVSETPSIDVGDVLAIEDMARPYNDELTRLAEEWTEGVDHLLRQRWNSGQFQKAPFSSYTQPMEFGFFAKAQAAASWTVVITLKREDCPDMAEMESRGAAARRKRGYAVEQYLAKRGYR